MRVLLGRIPYARVGSTPRPIVVVAGGQAFVQRPTAERFARHARRVARVLPPDRSFLLVGYDPSPPDYSLATIGDDLGAILDELGGRSTVVGISYGGIAALCAASAHPSRIDRLVLIASAHDFSAEGKQRVRHQIECAERGDLVALAEGFVAVFRRPWFNWLVRARVRASRPRIAESLNDPSLIVRGLRAVLDHPLDVARLARVIAPCLLVAGTRDQFFGGMQARTAQHVPHARVELVADETHMLPVERARRVAAAVGGFLA